ncbi:Uncharacterised protein [Mycobacteroides abscessus subsp. massiliense]|nr:Uncharacterised protein [Mycobacteroides abscessus subsp. massiliense]
MNQRRAVHQRVVDIEKRGRGQVGGRRPWRLLGGRVRLGEGCGACDVLGESLGEHLLLGGAFGSGFAVDLGAGHAWLPALPVRSVRMPFNPTEGGEDAGDPVAELAYDVVNAADAGRMRCLRPCRERVGGLGRRVRRHTHCHRCR